MESELKSIEGLHQIRHIKDRSSLSSGDFSCDGFRSIMREKRRGMQ